MTTQTLTFELPMEAADFDAAELAAIRQAADDVIASAVSYNLSHRKGRSVIVETHSGLWFAACKCGWQGHTQPRDDAAAELIAHEAEHAPQNVAETVTVPLPAPYRSRTVKGALDGSWISQCDCGWEGALRYGTGARSAAVRDRHDHDTDHEEAASDDRMQLEVSR